MQSRLKDLSKLSDTYAQLLKDAVYSDPIRLLSLVCLTYLEEIRGNDNFIFSNDDQEFIQEYFLKDGRWFRVEYSVFANLCYSLPFQINKRICRNMFAQYNKFHLNEYSSLIVGVVHNISIYLLENKLPLLAIEILSDDWMYDLPTKDFYTQFHINFLKITALVMNDATNLTNRHNLSVLLESLKITSPVEYRRLSDWVNSLNIFP